ncbi:MAG: hypothetical protein MJ227_00065 [Bacilli bacterium]|nr:hypothetical protein [Bacilli bacterium]
MNIELIKSSLEEKLSSLGYKLYSLSLKREKGNNVLSIVVDRVKPINMDDIVDLTGKISSYLDEIDISNDSYILDISSLGAEKPLEINELSQYIDSYINIHLINAINGENIYEGYIREVNEKELIIETRKKTRVIKLVILLNNIYKIRLAIKF